MSVVTLALVSALDFARELEERLDARVAKQRCRSSCSLTRRREGRAEKLRCRRGTLRERFGYRLHGAILQVPEGFQRSEFLLEHGAIDMIVDRRDMRDKITSILKKLLPAQSAET